MNLNHVIIAGRVTADLTLRTTPSGQSVASMGVATNRSWTTKDGAKQEEVEFHSVVIWGKQAESATTYLKKGQLVLVEGRLATRAWQDKDGHDRKTTEIIAERVEFGPGVNGAPAARPAMSARPKMEKPELAEEETIPVINLDGDEEDIGRSLTQAFGEDEIKPEEIPF
jgi:single-strand DNA-binding protein